MFEIFLSYITDSIQICLAMNENNRLRTQEGSSPAEMLRGRTGRGSEAPSALGVKPGTTEVAVLISLSRLLTP